MPTQLCSSRDLRVINHAMVRIVSKTHFFPAVIAQKLLHSCSVLETASRTSLRLLSNLPTYSCLFGDDSEKSKVNNRNSVWMSFLLVVMFFTSFAHWLLHIRRKLHVVIRLLYVLDTSDVHNTSILLVLMGAVTVISAHAERK